MNDVIDRLAASAQAEPQQVVEPEVETATPTETPAPAQPTSANEQFAKLGELLSAGNRVGTNTRLAEINAFKVRHEHGQGDAVSADTGIDKLANIGASFLGGAANVVTGTAHLFLSSGASESLSKATDTRSLMSSESQHRKVIQAEEMADYDRLLQHEVDAGRLTEGKAEWMRVKKSASMMTADDVSEFLATGAGSFAGMAIAARLAPALLPLAIGTSGLATLAEAATGVREELYKRNADGEFETPHTVLMASSLDTEKQTYAKTYQETGSENQAREALYNELKYNTVTDPKVLLTAAYETIGDMAIMWMGGAFKGLKTALAAVPKGAVKPGITTSIKQSMDAAKKLADVRMAEMNVLKRWFVGGVHEGFSEGMGSGTRAYTVNQQIQANVNPEHKLTEGLHKVLPDVIGGLGAGPSLAALNAGITTAQVGAAAVGALTGSARKLSKKDKGEQPSVVPAVELKSTERPASDAIQATLVDVPDDKKAHYAAIEKWTNPETEVALTETSKKYVAESKDPEIVLKKLIQAITNPDTPIEDAAELAADAFASTQDLFNAMDAVRDEVNTSGSVEQRQALKDLDDMEAKAGAVPGYAERLQKVVDYVRTLDVNDSEQGAKNLRLRMQLDPTGIPAKALEMFNPDSVFLTATDKTKLDTLKAGLEKAAAINEAAAKTGTSSNLDIVNREFSTDRNAPKNRKKLSVLAHTMGIIDRMEKGDTEGAKQQLANLFRLGQSHKNKLAAFKEAMANGATDVEYETYAPGSSSPITGRMKIVGGTPALMKAMEYELEFLEWAHNSLAENYGDKLTASVDFTDKASSPDVVYSADAIQKLEDSELNDAVQALETKRKQRELSTPENNALKRLRKEAKARKAPVKGVQEFLNLGKEAAVRRIKSFAENELQGLLTDLHSLRKTDPTQEDPRVAKAIVAVQAELQSRKPVTAPLDTRISLKGNEQTEAVQALSDKELSEDIQAVTAQIAKAKGVDVGPQKAYLTALMAEHDSRKSPNIKKYLAYSPEIQAKEAKRLTDKQLNSLIRDGEELMSFAGIGEQRREQEILTDLLSVLRNEQDSRKKATTLANRVSLTPEAQKAYLQGLSEQELQAELDALNALTEAQATKLGMEEVESYVVLVQETLDALQEEDSSGSSGQGTQAPTPTAPEPGLVKGRTDTAAMVEQLSKSPEAYNNFFTDMSTRLGDRIVELEKMIEGLDNDLTIDELRSIYLAAKRRLPTSTPTQTSTPQVPTVTPPSTPTKTALQERVELITKAIEDNASNVREVTIAGKVRKYVLLGDGKVYNIKGKEMVAERILKAFGSDIFNQSESTPVGKAAVEENSEDGITEVAEDKAHITTEEEHQAAKALASKLPVGKHLKFSAAKTWLFAKDFMQSWYNKLVGHKNEAYKTYVSYMDTTINDLLTLMGDYQNGTPAQGTWLAAVHKSMGTAQLSTLAMPEKTYVRKQIQTTLEQAGVIDSMTDGEFLSWLSQKFPVNSKGTKEENNQRERSTLANLLPNNPELVNQVYRDVVAMYESYRFLDLLEYDATNNRFSMPNEVLNAVSVAMVEYLGNFRNYAPKYTTEDKFMAAFGVTKSWVNLYPSAKDKADNKNGVFADISDLASRGVVSYDLAMAGLAKLANSFLGVKFNKDSGTGLSQAPMQSLMSGMLWNTLKLNAGNVNAMPMHLMYMDTGGAYPIPVLISNGAPIDGSILDILTSLDDVGKKAVLAETDRRRHINKVPKAKTTNLAGESLTKMQHQNLSTQNRVPFKVIIPTLNLWTKVMDVPGVLELFGFDTGRELNKYDAEAKEGKNLQLINAIKELKTIQQEIEELGLSTEEATIYYNNNVSDVSRIMMEGSYNPQGDKLVRSVISPTRAVVDASDIPSVLTTGTEVPTQGMGKFFMLAIGQAFGIKIHNQTMAETHAQIQGLFRDTGLLELASKWHEATKGTEAMGAEEAIALIAETKTLAKTLGIDVSEVALQALIEVGALQDSATNLKEYTTHLYIEADGLTNGPFMAGFLAGISPTDPAWINFMSNAGLYFGTVESGNQYRSARFNDPESGNPDNYFAVASRAAVLMQQVLKKAAKLIPKMFIPERLQNTWADRSNAKEVMRATQFIMSQMFSHIKQNSDGTLALTRNSAKGPVTVTFYGASPASIADTFTAEVRKLLHEMATELYNSPINTVAEMFIKGDMTTQKKVETLHQLLEALKTATSGSLHMGERMNRKTGKKEDYIAWVGDIQPGINITTKQGDKSLLTLNLTGKHYDTLSKNLDTFFVGSLVTSLKELAGSTLAANEIIGEATNKYSVLAATVFMSYVNDLVSSGAYDPVVGLSPRQINDIRKKMNLFGITGSISDMLFSLVKDTTKGALTHAVSGIGAPGKETASGLRTLVPMGVAGIPRFIISMGDAAVANKVLSQAVEVINNHFLQVYDGFNFSAENFMEGGRLVNEAALDTMSPRAMTGLLAQIRENQHKLFNELQQRVPGLTTQINSAAELQVLQRQIAEQLGEEAANTLIHSIVRLVTKMEVLGKSLPVTHQNKFDDVLYESGPIQVMPSFLRTREDIANYLKSFNRREDAEYIYYKFLVPQSVILERFSFNEIVNGKVDLGVLMIETGNAVFSTTALHGLVKNIIAGFDALADKALTLDQYASMEAAAYKPGAEPPSSNANDIAAWVAESVANSPTPQRAKGIEAPAIDSDTIKNLFKGQLGQSMQGKGTITEGGIIKALLSHAAAAFGKADANDLRQQLTSHVGELLRRRIEQGMKFQYDPKAQVSYYDTETDTLVLNNLKAETLLHEGLHALTTHTLEVYFQGNQSSLPVGVQQAIANLSGLLAELKADPRVITDPRWALVMNHIRAMGAKAIGNGAPELAQAYEISELVSSFLADPLLALDLQHTKTRTVLQEVGDSIMSFVRYLLRVPTKVSDQSMFQALASNALVLGNHAAWHTPNTLGGPSVQLEYPPTNSRTARAKTAIGQGLNAIIHRERTAYTQADLARDFKYTNVGRNLASAGFNLTDDQQQEVNVLGAAILSGARIAPEAHKELYRLGAYLVSQLKLEHFGDVSVPDSPAYMTAVTKHTAVTGTALGTRRSLIPALIALAMVNPEFRDIVDSIGFPKAEQSTETESTFEKRLGQLGYDAIHTLTNALSDVTATVPSSAYAELLATVKKPEGGLVKAANFPSTILRTLDAQVSTVLSAAGKAAIAQGTRISKNAGTLPKVFGAALDALGATLDGETAAAVAESTLSKLGQSTAWHGLKDMLRDVIQRTDSNAGVYDLNKMVRSFIQRTRQMYVSGTPKTLYSKFKGKVSKEAMESLTYSMGHTDMAALTHNRTPAEALELLSNKNRISSRVYNIEQMFNKTTLGADRLDKAEQLARFMATSETGNKLLTNATDIYTMKHTKDYKDIVPDLTEVLLLDEYISLRAFQLSDTGVFEDLLRDEKDALVYTLSFMQGLRKGDLNAAGFPTGVKGHMHTTHRGDVKIVSSRDVVFFESRGYRKVADYIDPVTRRVAGGYFISNLSENRPFSQGILQNIVPTNNGTDAVTGMHYGERFIPITGLSRPEMEALVENSKGKFGVVPVYNSEGKIVGISRVVDPTVLKEMDGERRLAQVLGVHKGRQVEEAIAPAFNEAVVDELNQNYEKATDKSTYVDLLNPVELLANPVFADALKILSPRALEYAKDKHKKLMVDRNMLTQVIGYRQMHIANLWDGNTNLNPEVRSALRSALETLLGKKAYYYAASTQEVVMGTVAGMKRIMIVKSVIVPVLNALSNLLHLVARNVPWADISKGVAVKVAEIEQYSAGMKRLIEIEADKTTAGGSTYKIRQLDAEADAIKAYHTTLSIWPLLQAGEFTSIISTQVDAEVGGLERGKIAEYIEGHIERLSGGAKTTAKNLMVTEDSAVFQFLQKTVDYGDFVAKSILYDHNIKNKGMHPDDAMGPIRQEFINYDFLPGRIRGMLEGVGLLWFFNYKVRAAKVALAMLRENPVSLLFAGSLPANTWFGSVDMPLTANIFTQFADGSLGYSIGPGMGLEAPRLHPLSQLLGLAL